MHYFSTDAEVYIFLVLLISTILDHCLNLCVLFTTCFTCTLFLCFILCFYFYCTLILYLYSNTFVSSLKRTMSLGRLNRKRNREINVDSQSELSVQKSSL